MMSAKDKTYLPAKVTEKNSKDRLKNDIIQWIGKNEAGWSASEAELLGNQFLNILISQTKFNFLSEFEMVELNCMHFVC